MTQGGENGRKCMYMHIILPSIGYTGRWDDIANKLHFCSCRTAWRGV